MAIKWFTKYKGYINQISDWDYEVLDACKEALAECEQAEPAAWIEYKYEQDAEGLLYPVTYLHEYDNGNSLPLYTAPQDQSAEIERLNIIIKTIKQSMQFIINIPESNQSQKDVLKGLLEAIKESEI